MGWHWNHGRDFIIRKGRLFQNFPITDEVWFQIHIHIIDPLNHFLFFENTLWHYEHRNMKPHMHIPVHLIESVFDIALYGNYFFIYVLPFLKLNNLFMLFFFLVMNRHFRPESPCLNICCDLRMGGIYRLIRKIFNL